LLALLSVILELYALFPSKVFGYRREKKRASPVSHIIKCIVIDIEKINVKKISFFLCLFDFLVRMTDYTYSDTCQLVHICFFFGQKIINNIDLSVLANIL